MEILKKAQKRTAEDNRALRNTVSEIIDRITEEGDAALREYSEKFDGFRRASFRVSREEIDRAYEMMTAQEIQDLKDAKANIRAFAEAQRGSLTGAELSLLCSGRETPAVLFGTDADHTGAGCGGEADLRRLPH